MTKSIDTTLTPMHLRRAVIGLAGLGAISLGLSVSAAAQDDLPGKLVDDLHSAFGVHHARAVHSKGIVLSGSYSPSPAARQLSSASIFAKAMPVTVRFSDFTGIPTIPDTSGNADPRGMAIKFGTVDDAALDIVAHSFNGFPVKTSAEFGELMRAIGSSGPTAAKPTALDNFLGAHPIAATFLTTQKAPPASWATSAYFGVNAFTFTDSRGGKTNVRYRFVPRAGEHQLDGATLKTKGENYLSTEIAARVAKAPIEFDWYAQVAVAGDRLDDPSIAWPEARRLVKLGTIRIDRLSRDQAGDDKRLMFLPGNVPAGIDAADPMIDVRTAAYPISFAKRQ